MLVPFQGLLELFQFNNILPMHLNLTWTLKAVYIPTGSISILVTYGTLSFEWSGQTVVNQEINKSKLIKVSIMVPELIKSLVNKPLTGRTV